MPMLVFTRTLLMVTGLGVEKLPQIAAVLRKMDFSTPTGVYTHNSSRSR
jgi:hypothetical protein